MLVPVFVAVAVPVLVLVGVHFSPDRCLLAKLFSLIETADTADRAAGVFLAKLFC